jgi:SAM-dependent methyltransferase
MMPYSSSSSPSSISFGTLSNYVIFVAISISLSIATSDGFLTPYSIFPFGGRMQYPLSSSSKHTLSASPSGEGFGDATTSKKTSANNNEQNNRKGEIYSRPSLYDMAFGYRNFEEEVDFLMDQHRKLDPDQKLPKRVLELAAGPARHCIEALAASYVESATAIDNSADMVEYARETAAEELKSDDYTFEEISGKEQGDVTKDTGYEDRVNSLRYIQADMANFTIDGGAALFDSAWILLGSLQHLTTNEEVISCFRCIHRALRPNGTFIIELPHPRETFSLVECTRNGWEVPLEDENGGTSGELKIVWGDNNDDFDPITQVRQFTVSMELTGEDASKAPLQSVREVVPMRHFTSQEIDLLARLSGFEVMSMHGALQFDVDVNDDEAFRLVCVLQKKEI